MSATLRHDLLASVVVFLVALPLTMGIAIASGAPPAAGIITGIIGGVVVGLLAGSPLQVSGPAAGLTVIVYAFIQTHGLEAFGVAVLIAGAVQLVAGFLKLGQWFRAVSPAVIQGMLAGIGLLLVAGQFHVMVDDAPKASGIANLLSIPEAVWKGVVPLDGSEHHWAARIGLLTILIMALWKLSVPKSLKIIPAPLVAVVVATLVAEFSGLTVRRVPLPHDLAAAIDWIHPLDYHYMLQWPVVQAGLTIALVASAETLLCASAVDKMHSGPRTRYDRELVAQGVGNLLCGVVGSLPMTGVIVRSAANVEAGARTRLSAILHGLWLLLFVWLLPFVLERIPVCSLAAVLVFTGWKLMDIKAIKVLRRYGRSEVLIYAATVVTIVGTDLLAGVLTGVGLSMLRLLWVFSKFQVRVVQDPARRRATLFLNGAATFILLPRLAEALDSVAPNTELHVHFEELTFIDHACLDLLMTWEKQHETTGGSLEIDWQGLHARFNQDPTKKNGVTAQAREVA